MNLETLPGRMRGLPVDERNFPIPWFVAYHEGKPEFRAMDPAKFKAAIEKKLCWVCGERLGVYKAFVAGPMCGINRVSSEPPAHVDCARWSACNCPFLSNPRAVRREDEFSDKFNANIAGFGQMRNPGVSMLWITRSYDVFRSPAGGKGHLITMGEPESVEWYCEGRIANRAEVQASIDTGLPTQEALARQEEGGLEFLKRAIERFQKYLPGE